MKLLLTTILIAAFFAVAATAQENKNTDYSQSALKKTELQKLDSMVGRWSGEGWIMQGPTREEFAGTEFVQRKVGGLALLVEGRFTDKKDSTKVIHETLGVLSFNPKNADYDFKTYLATGNSGDFKLTIKDEAFEWGFEMPVGKIIYIIKIKDGIWNEVGKISRDGGKTWLQFFEMNLKKMP